MKHHPKSTGCAALRERLPDVDRALSDARAAIAPAEAAKLAALDSGDLEAISRTRSEHELRLHVAARCERERAALLAEIQSARVAELHAEHSAICASVANDAIERELAPHVAGIAAAYETIASELAATQRVLAAASSRCARAKALDKELDIRIYHDRSAGLPHVHGLIETALRARILELAEGDAVRERLAYLLSRLRP